VRTGRLPYARQSLGRSDLEAVLEVLRCDWLTAGPKVEEFERTFAEAVGASEAVAVSSGTAALHAAMHAAGIGPGDEVIVPAMTFVASANSVVFRGATPVFADVYPDTLLLDLADAKRKLTARTRAILAVDYAGQPCEYERLRALADEYGVFLIADAAHSLGASYRERPVGSLANLTTFSFHPVKHITTGEGGMVTCDNPRWAASMRSFRNHGIDREPRQRAADQSYDYDMVELGFNYRLTDFQCALGLSQLQKLPDFVRRRQAIAACYDAAFAPWEPIQPLRRRPEVSHAYHLYVVRLDTSKLGASRGEICRALEAEGIGVNVHYKPVHLHSFYRRGFGTGPGLCPAAESVYPQLVTLPLFPAMGADDVEDVIHAVEKLL